MKGLKWWVAVTTQILLIYIFIAISSLGVWMGKILCELILNNTEIIIRFIILGWAIVGAIIITTGWLIFSYYMSLKIRDWFIKKEWMDR